MATLRQKLNSSRTWGIILTTLLLLCVVDSFRSPSGQVTGWLYVKMVRIYQAIGRPLIRDHVQCRYHPSCSDYSIEAVETHGIRWGLVLTYRRLNSCTGAVPLGTHDPVPPPDGEDG